MSGVWIFGYGSLVNPVSFGATVKRDMTLGVDVMPATLAGFGRRWNYGVGHLVGLGSEEPHATYTMVALGIVSAPVESATGVIGWVDTDRLADLDDREREYDRVDVTDAITIDMDHPVVHRSDLPTGPVETYVPRPVAIERYETARDEGVAAIEQRYWDLVAGAFAALGPDDHAHYYATTPTPDVPILHLRRR